MSRSIHDPRPGQSLLLNGLTINYQASLKQNVDTTIVMVHGFGAALESWDDVYPELASEYSVVRLDLKGSGFSSKPKDTSYSPIDQSEILLNFIDSIGLKKVIIIGHSLGGAVSLVSYIRNLDEIHNFKIDGLILIDSASYPQNLPFFIKALQNPVTRFLNRYVPKIVQTWIVLNRSMNVKSRITKDRINKYTFFLRLPGSEFSLAQTAIHIFPHKIYSFIQRIPEINIPVLIIWGKEDKVVPVENGYRLHSAISTSKLIVLPDTGHIPHEERPKEVYALVNDFVRSLL